MGTKRDAYVEKLQGNIAKWNGELDEIEVKAKQAKDDAKAEFNKQIEEIKAKRQALEAKMTELKSSSEEAWEDVKKGVDIARQVLGQAINSAKERFTTKVG
jgi:chromosome segregation ATPase